MSKRRNRAIRNVSEKVDEVKETATAEVKADVEIEKAATAEVEAENAATEVKAEVEAEKPVEVEVKTEVEKKAATDVFVQYGSVEVKAKDIVAKIKNLYSESGKNVDDIDTLKVYIKPEENVAYYVINEEEKGSVSL